MTFDLRRFMEEPEWMESAECRRVGPNLFFPTTEAEPQRTRDRDRAKAVCRRCEVQAECLAFAMNNGEHHGVWGGLDETERRRLARGRPEALRPPPTSTTEPSPEPQRIDVEANGPAMTASAPPPSTAASLVRAGA